MSWLTYFLFPPDFESAISVIPLKVIGMIPMCGSRGGGGGGGRGSGPPLKNHKNIGFLSNTGPDPLKNHKATKPAFSVVPLSAHQRNAILWRLAGGPMIACF